MSDKPSIWLVRKGELLLPRARFDAEALTRYREGVTLRAELTEPRSGGVNRLYWSVLSAVCAATGKWSSSEVLHHALKMHLGYFESYASVHGEVDTRAQSTAFDRMDAAKFREYFDAAMLTITTEILPGLTVEDILALGKARLTERAA
ncbi:hypothetical protein Xaut_3678 [Xanthobacter versatilis]|uniref:Uncharacterized protein n=1 Tax=Xanthobacter autotrophicus (strain ATCC BAA-1158 / Py2) TaxID=78245 RepID=A7ILL3_XANP2|nr:hypothetical protein Xaut_3678 [Xanthobacter autotrophicus Py2]